ncbi:hypothetical protein ACR79P_05840 [Sphingobacterium spiritivorum]|uniref:hypothetical protein n=1 Tax=Sphingobacterium spiritivorum TaxID=258 RepID=UPI003DA47BA3
MKHFGFLLICLFFLSCSKKDIYPVEQNGDKLSLQQTLTASTPYYFDWESAERMPIPAGQSTILSPWASGANIAFPASFIEDRFKLDGWELVYSSFSKTEVINPKFFILYNKYRGVLRAFFYLDPISPTPSAYVSHSLKLKDNQATSILNYGTSEIVSLANNVKEISQVQSYRTSSTGCWYGGEFEINYVPSQRNISGQNSLLQWDVNSINISQISLNGTSNGTIKGTMSQNVAGPENILNKALNGSLETINNGMVDQLKNELNIKTDFVNDFIVALGTGNLNTAAGKILSAIFGRSSVNSSQIINLKTSANYSFTGTINDSYLIASPILLPPGASNSGTQMGILPIYNKVLGIFTLDNTPLVNANSQEEWYTERAEPNERDERFSIFNPIDYKLVQNSYNIVFNPDIINTNIDGAKIENLKQNLIKRISNNASIQEYPLNYEFSNHYRINVGHVGWSPDGYTPQPASPSPWDSNYLMKDFFLRITFDVVPNDGSPRTKIVKTFKVRANDQIIRS